jgi:hypothetical protein
MKKKLIIYGISLTVFLLAGSIYTNIVKADCVSCDNFLDTGLCDKSDINNKFCGIGSSRDCYPGGCEDNPIE